MGRMRSKTVSGALIPTETTVQSYDDVRRDANLVYYSNNGRLTTAIKTVPATGAIAAVNVQHQMNYDVAGRLVNEWVNLPDATGKSLNYDYWMDGSVKRKQLADGTWTGQYVYDLGFSDSPQNLTRGTVTSSVTVPDLCSELEVWGQI
jgi:hypothetical protein